ncbi:hypothetical protein [Mesorhizobium sp. M4B.F.Ca.ET.169.01.1.1]|uniref:hypothetical protein n=1 Tax=Mesorhizobium sp. M4B.F.Ca.ET.169.01.1.1 TaxID=2563949 RepID=UPI0016784706|nr:hypothetical protein [Mesorhizobium sp. M4B.F.Ca.ET.169.01.1.1]
MIAKILAQSGGEIIADGSFRPLRAASAVAISYGDRATPPLGGREVRALWQEYGERLLEA